MLCNKDGFLEDKQHDHTRLLRDYACLSYYNTADAEAAWQSHTRSFIFCK